MLRILWVYFNALMYVLFHIIPIRRRYKHPERYSIEERFRHIGRLSRIIVQRTGLKVNIIGKEYLLDEPVLYVVNHPSMIDPYFVSYASERQLGAVIAGDLWFEKIPVLSPWFKSFGCVYLDRKNPREAIKGINQAIENIGKGHSLILFPEGEITKFVTNDVLGPFQTGGLKIATKAKAPVIPMVVIGTDDVYTAHEVIGKLKKGTVTVVILPPYRRHMTEEVSAQVISDDLETMMKNKILEYKKANRI